MSRYPCSLSLSLPLGHGFSCKLRDLSHFPRCSWRKGIPMRLMSVGSTYHTRRLAQRPAFPTFRTPLRQRLQVCSGSLNKPPKVHTTSQPLCRSSANPPGCSTMTTRTSGSVWTLPWCAQSQSRVQALRCSQFGMTSIDLSRYDLGQEYKISNGVCEVAFDFICACLLRSARSIRSLSCT